ncbi:uncharacterized protein PAC_17738 [Phialocephala subalpina]|uniref:Uncharacterized protein n=1 Tax=Phialocephala subalpina TaxID=576137 RepID=A0A1L7XS85_9HELO|nr:uncharacterized protein PAC_17738 [Phialocephala subalpina]
MIKPIENQRKGLAYLKSTSSADASKSSETSTNHHREHPTAKAPASSQPIPGPASKNNHQAYPAQRVENIKSAITFLTSTDGANAERIGVLGICDSGGYVCNAAQTNVRIKSFATIVAVCTGVMAREGLPKGTSNLEVLKGQLAAAAQDRNGEAKGKKPTTVTMIPDKLEDAPADMPSAFRDLLSYYRTPRRNHPRAPNIALPRS